MTSSGKSTKGIPLGLLVLAVAGIGLFAGWLFVLCVLTFRRGIVGELGRVLRRPF